MHRFQPLTLSISIWVLAVFEVLAWVWYEIERMGIKDTRLSISVFDSFLPISSKRESHLNQFEHQSISRIRVGAIRKVRIDFQNLSRSERVVQLIFSPSQKGSTGAEGDDVRGWKRWAERDLNLNSWNWWRARRNWWSPTIDYARRKWWAGRNFPVGWLFARLIKGRYSTTELPESLNKTNARL